jgi:hypothetical protein
MIVLRHQLRYARGAFTLVKPAIHQRRHLVTDFVRETFARRGMIADVNIHEPHQKNDDRNYHVHCLLTMRRLDGENFAAKKETLWNKKTELAEWREKWAHMGAKALERAGFQQEANRFRHGHKLLADQMKAAVALGDREWAHRCDREAQIHKGAAVSAMEQRNDPRLADNEIAREAKAIDDRNAARAEIKELEKELAAARQEAEQQRQPEPEQAKPAPEIPAWQNRGATQTEEKLFHMLDAAERNGTPVDAALWKEGITIARVDAAGIAAKDAQYRREFEAEKAQGDPDARLRRSVVQEGELVALNKWGDVYRLNPGFVQLDKLERAATGGDTPTLSATLDDLRINSHQFREETRMEKTINALHDRAAFQDGKTFRGLLYDEGILLSRVDEVGIAMKDAQYRREFENDRLEDIRNGTHDARLRVSQEQEGELVAVTKSGHVFRLNPNFVDRDALERAYQSSGFETPKLSESLQHFADARQQQTADRQAAQHTRYDAREGQRQQKNVAHDVKQGAQTALGAATGKDTALKVMTGAGVKLLENFVAALFSGTGDRPPPTSEQRAQQRALIALERIADSFEAGENLRASDVANLLPTQLENLKRHGDAYMLEIISDLERDRRNERERENERGLGH